MNNVLPSLFTKEKEVEKATPEVSPEPQGFSTYNKAVSMESDDLHKWEMEVEGLLDNIYNSLLGKSKVDGVWVYK